MAMVRTGETRLSVGSALMIACRDGRTVSRQASRSPTMTREGLGCTVTTMAGALPGLQPGGPDVVRWAPIPHALRSFHDQLAFDVLGEVAQSCPTLCDPRTIQSLEFFRPGYWSG